MADKRRCRKRSAGSSSETGQSVVAIEIRRERYEIAPAPGYQTTVILLDEYRAWLNSLKDRTAQARIAYEVGKLARGLMGDWKEVSGVFEMRIDYGPGYRVYFSKHGKIVFQVAYGGDKSSQHADIETAIGIWREVKDGIKEIRK